MINKLCHNFLWHLTEMFPNRVRDIRVNGDLYLRRFYITPTKINEKTGQLCDEGYGIFLHYFYKSDEDRELHDHPWDKALSFILTGGYFEEYRNNTTNEVDVREVKPGRFNFIKNNQFHRVLSKSHNPHVWTLFVAGKRIKNWGFWNRETNEYIPHEQFLSSK